MYRTGLERTNSDCVVSQAGANNTVLGNRECIVARSVKSSNGGVGLHVGHQTQLRWLELTKGGGDG